MPTAPEVATPLPASASPIRFARIAAFPAPGWQIPRRAQYSPDGKLVTYLQSESQSAEMALFAFDVATRKHSVLVRAKDLVDTNRKMSREEELRRERQRKRIQGVTSYSWARKANVLLLPLGGNVFVRTADGKIKQLTNTPEPEIDPKLSADGSTVAFVRGSEVFLVDVSSGKETQLTKGAETGVARGQSDFNMQEEFGEPSGMWWAPTSAHLVYLEVDERKVGQIPIMGYRKGADLQQHRYPRTGEANPVTRIGVLEIKSKKTAWIKLPATKRWDPADHYIGRVTWSRDGSTLFLQRLSRDQKHAAVVRVDPKTGKAEHILEHSDSTWAEMTEMRVLPSGDLVLTWPHDQRRHLRVIDGKSGTTRVQLTSGAWDVSHLVGVDDKRVLFVGNKDAVLDRVLYAVPLAGGAPTKLSTEDGVHHVSAAHAEHGWVDIHSSNSRLPKAELFGANGETVGSISVPLGDDFDKLQLRTPQLLTVKNDGKPDLYGAMLEPRNKKAGVRYPAIVMVYGGPGVQTTLNEYNPRLIWQHLADRGFVIFQIDNRGSTGRGHEFESPLYRKMGEVELEDQLRGLDYLSNLDFVAPKRVGIYGHSYGGYMATMAMLRAPGRFKAAVSGSPVIDWRFYDTGYTERFMGTPQNNPEGYASTELAKDAGNLVGKLFVIHALMDENVHFEHTAKLIDAFVAADKDFDLLVFPGERHGYRSPKARRYAFRRVVDFFVKHL